MTKKYHLNGLLFPALQTAGLLAAAMLVFTGCATTQAEKDSLTAAAKQSRSEMIVLREGDVLKISFPGSANLDTIQPIRRDGRIAMPLIGEVDAAGLTPDGLQEKLIKLYASQISTKEVIVFVQSSSFPVFVSGSVVHPGKILSNHPITALEAVMEAGG
ncbi:MAG TPA: polysaccharide biosynthesis/export family protein, partial [Candidatus Limnocylindrales bacterium]|nr:polysaccharide biosynthesis/export family protein [Candidatus Limnocylindrales bacterium]